MSEPTLYYRWEALYAEEVRLLEASLREPPGPRADELTAEYERVRDDRAALYSELVGDAVTYRGEGDE